MTTVDLAANGQAFSRAAQPAGRTRVLCVLFFFSGFPALIYQLTW
jgi:spermidine synthase